MKILFITYNTKNTPSCRYRSYQPAEALANSGVSAKVRLIYSLSKKEIDESDLVIFQRIPQAVWYFKRLCLPAFLIARRIEEVFHYSIRKKRTGIDLDDYIFLDENEIKTGVPSDFLPSLFRKCHFVTTTTEFLAGKLRKYNPSVTVLPNAIDFDLYEKSGYSGEADRIIRQMQSCKKVGRVVFGWAAGETHARDAELFREIVGKLDAELRKRVKFFLIGNPKSFPGRDSSVVYPTKRIPWRELPAVLRHLDTNLVVLKDTLLNRSKSELKLIEAGYFGVPSIASRLGVFGDLIKEGENGLLASSVSEWIEKIRELVEKKELRERLGSNIRKLVREHYDLRKRGREYAEYYEGILQKLAENVR